MKSSDSYRESALLIEISGEDLDQLIRLLAEHERPRRRHVLEPGSVLLEYLRERQDTCRRFCAE